jgi:hypothetical protein
MEILEVLIDGVSCGKTSGYITTYMIKRVVCNKAGTVVTLMFNRNTINARLYFNDVVIVYDPCVSSNFNPPGTIPESFSFITTPLSTVSVVIPWLNDYANLQFGNSGTWSICGL